MTTPDHSGVRPLSPYGEGYCRWCLFIVGLECDGLLSPHQRGFSVGRKECPGSDTRPPKVTPYASRKAAFRVKVAEAWCPGCGRKAPTVYRVAERVYDRHYLPSGAGCCPYYLKAVEEQG